MNRQRKIIEVFNNDRDKILSKKDIIQLSGIDYYHNTEKHVGNVLSRMVRNGLICRVKKGYYKLGLLKRKIKNDDIDNPNQTELF